MLTPREFAVLREVYERPVKRWAIDRAMFANVHMRSKDNDTAYEPDDFLGIGDRERRRQEQMVAKVAGFAANARVHQQAKQAPAGDASLDKALSIFRGKG